MNTPRLVEARKELYSILETPIDQPSVYFVVSIDNFKQILSSGEIKPRACVKNILKDYSSGTMQQRREGRVFLGYGISNAKPNVPTEIHECCNFFWNPINTTLDAFCRNSIISGSLDHDVVILEINLSRVIENVPADRITWASSKHNLATWADNYHTSDPSKLFNIDWPWKGIFSVNDIDRDSRERKAELVCQIKGSRWGISLTGIPVTAISKCIVHNQSNVSTLGGIISCPIVIKSFFKSIEVLLTKDAQFIDFFKKRLDEPDKLIDEFDSYEKFMLEHRLSLSASDFANPDIGLNFIHGIPHVSRVMFWSFVLAATFRGEAATDVETNEFYEDCLWAASLHDLCRSNNDEDENHGLIASEKYRLETERRCGGNKTRVKHILEAVTYHCRPDNEYNDKNNIVYKILKDADALDRGRFGVPCFGSDYNGTGCFAANCKHAGCAYKTLRLYSAEKEQLFREIAWAAYNLAQSTKFAPWTGRDAHIQLTTFIRNAHLALLASKKFREKAEPKDDEFLVWLRATFTASGKLKNPIPPTSSTTGI